MAHIQFVNKLSHILNHTMYEKKSQLNVSKNICMFSTSIIHDFASNKNSVCMLLPTIFKY